MTKLLALQIVKGKVADYATDVARNENVKEKELAVILKEIACELEK